MNTAKERAAQYASALDAANNSAILSRSQYRAGLTDFTTLNTAESQLLSARNGLTQAKADQATALIQLYLALGGGWDSTTVPTAPDTPATFQPPEEQWWPIRLSPPPRVTRTSSSGKTNPRSEERRGGKEWVSTG